MKSRKLWLGAIAVALVGAPLTSHSVRQRAVWQQRVVAQQRVSKLRQISSSGGDYAALAALFLNPTKVEAYRMESNSGRPPAIIGKIDGFDYSAKRIGLSREFALRIGGLVFAPTPKPTSSTGFQMATRGCAFTPTVGFRVVQGSKWANVVLCLGCGQLMVVEPQAPISSIGGQIARFRIGREFDLDRAEFLALAKEAFPLDTTLG